MFGTTGKTAWRLLAAVPFVLLLGIVGIKLTAGDPNSPLNNVPGVQTIYELGEDAPSSNVNARLPKTKSPKPSQSTSATPSASASESASAKPSPSATKVASPTKKPTSGGGGSSPDPEPSNEPTKEPTKQPSSPPPPPPTCEEKYAGYPLKIIQCNQGWIS